MSRDTTHRRQFLIAGAAVVSPDDRVGCVDDPTRATREAIAHYKANVSRA